MKFDLPDMVSGMEAKAPTSSSTVTIIEIHKMESHVGSLTFLISITVTLLCKTCTVIIIIIKVVSAHLVHTVSCHIGPGLDLSILRLVPFFNE